MQPEGLDKSLRRLKMATGGTCAMQMQKNSGIAGMLALALAVGAGPGRHAWAAEPAGKAADTSMKLPLEGETTTPNWRTLPTGEDLEREYPQLAQMLDLAGGATITCVAETDGRVDQCHVVSEWPLGVGFGAAAMRSAAYFTMKPATLDGRPVPGVVTIPLQFKLAEGASQEAKEAPLAPADPTALALARQVIALQGIASIAREDWRRMVERQAAAAVANGEAASGQIALDALRQGLEEAIATYVERRAHELAVKMGVPELQATVAFLTSPAGKAWTAVDRDVRNRDGEAFNRQIAQAAHAHLCAQVSCTGPAS